jgi:hypothetical protein
MVQTQSPPWWAHGWRSSVERNRPELTAKINHCKHTVPHPLQLAWRGTISFSWTSSLSTRGGGEWSDQTSGRREWEILQAPSTSMQNVTDPPLGLVAWSPSDQICRIGKNRANDTQLDTQPLPRDSRKTLAWEICGPSIWPAKRVLTQRTRTKGVA